VSSRGSVSLFTTVFNRHTWHQEVWLDDDGMNDIFVKVIGIVKDLSTLEFLTCINIENKLGGFSTNVQDCYDHGLPVTSYGLALLME
jgi:hypothetical protein